MKTVYKLISKSFLGPMVLWFFIVTFVLMMNFLFRYVDELVGKGLSFGLVAELLMWASMTMIPIGLPLVVLLASIMTMGELGENNELLAMKCAGMSLTRIFVPLFVLVGLISVGSFFSVNNLVPASFKKMYALLYDIRRTSRNLEFKEGVFVNTLPDMSIRIERKGAENPAMGGPLMEDILIYDTSDPNKMTTTAADSGYLRLSDDQNYLLVTLYNGETVQENRGRRWDPATGTFDHYAFAMQNMVQPVDGFTMERSNDSIFIGVNQQTKSLHELSHDIDSLQHRVDSVVESLNDRFLSGTLLRYNREMAIDTLEQHRTRQADLLDSIGRLGGEQRARLIREAFSAGVNARSQINYEESTSKQDLDALYKHQANWHQILSLPVSIFIFFLIGASLGAIIRKGGLGMPIVVSVSFFLVYYVINMFGSKLAKEGTWSAFAGMWLSSFILAPLAAFLCYKANNDSNLLNTDWYYAHFQALKKALAPYFPKSKKKTNEPAKT